MASFEPSELSFLRRLIQNECWSDICKCHQLSKWIFCAGLGDDRSAPRQDRDRPHHADELIHARLQPEEAEREAEVGVDGAAAVGHRGTSCVYDLTDHHHHGPRWRTANVMWHPSTLLNLPLLDDLQPGETQNHFNCFLRSICQYIICYQPLASALCSLCEAWTWLQRPLLKFSSWSSQL